MRVSPSYREWSVALQSQLCAYTFDRWPRAGGATPWLLTPTAALPPAAAMQLEQLVQVLRNSYSDNSEARKSSLEQLNKVRLFLGCFCFTCLISPAAASAVALGGEMQQKPRAPFISFSSLFSLRMTERCGGIVWLSQNASCLRSSTGSCLQAVSFPAMVRLPIRSDRQRCCWWTIHDPLAHHIEHRITKTSAFATCDGDLFFCLPPIFLWSTPGTPNSSFAPSVLLHPPHLIFK